MRRLVIAVLLCLLFAAPAAAGKCEDVKVQYLIERAWRTTQTRILEALADVRKKAHFNLPLTLCGMDDPSIPTLFVMADGKAVYRVIIHEGLAATFTDRELRAALGHEVAHITLKHVGRTRLETERESINREVAADAQAAKWYGAAAMRGALEKIDKTFKESFLPKVAETAGLMLLSPDKEMTLRKSALNR